jgi:hypothetical protein
MHTAWRVLCVWRPYRSEDETDVKKSSAEINNKSGAAVPKIIHRAFVSPNNECSTVTLAQTLKPNNVASLTSEL